MWNRPLRVGGLIVPRALTELIKAGGWVPPPDERVFVEIFGEGPEQPSFYGKAELVRQNASWQALDEHQVGGIDPRQTIVIGDLGPDMPFVLDYRASRDVPPVLYLGGPGTSHWIRVASNIEELIDRLYAG